MPDRARKQRFVFLAILLMLFFSYPLLSVADKMKLLGGIPVLFVYIFLVWIAGILLLYRTAENRDSKRKTGT